MPLRAAGAGVQTRLLLSYGLLLALMVAVGFVGWSGINNIQQALDRLQQENLPDIARSLALAEQTSGLVAQAASIANSTILFHLDQESARLESRLSAFLDLVRDANSSEPGTLTGLANSMEDTLYDLVDVTRQGIFLDADIRDRRYRLLSLHRRLENSIEAAFPVPPGGTRSNQRRLLLVQMLAEMHRIVGALYAAATAENEDSLQALEQRYERGKRVITELLEHASDGLIPVATPRLISALLNQASGRDSLFVLRRQQIHSQDWRTFLLARSEVLSAELNRRVAADVARAEQATSEQSTAAARLVQSSEFRILVLGALYLTAGLIFGVYVVRDLGGNLSAITQAMLRLAGGDRSVTVAASRRPDEIGSLARAFDVFRENLLQLRQAQKMESVGQLTGGLAHDFNNLLTPVIGNLHSVQEQLSEHPKQRRQILQALAAAERAASITQRLLAFSRKQALHPQTVDVNELIEGMLDLLSFSVGKTIGIELCLQPDVWPVIIDPGQLENALMNLVLNSRDAMPGGGTLQITTACRQLAQSADLAAGDYVELRVQDSGCGMSEEVIARVFEPFYTTKAVGVGSGLGLSMVYGFIKQSGGHIRIDSIPQQGTAIHLYLPRAVDRTGTGQMPVYSTVATLAAKI